MAITPGHGRPAETETNGTEPGGVSPLPSPDLPSAVPHALFVVPARRGAGFQASIRGRMLDLADPGSADWLAPTPDDLFVSSIASDVAWYVRRFLRARDLGDSVSVYAGWRTADRPPHLADVDLTVTVPMAAEGVRATLVDVLESRYAARSPDAPVRIRVEGS